MAKLRSGDLDSRSQVGPDDEYIELSELDFDDLPPTDPVGIRPRLVPPRPQRNPDFDQLRHFLRTPACVEFEDDRAVDLTPPPVVGSSSIAPTSASLPPQHVTRDIASSSSSRWSLHIVALSATIAIGIIAYRVADTTKAFAPSTTEAAAVVQPATVIPSFTPEDFAVFEDPAEDKVEWTWIDLTNAPREDWPASGKPPSTLSEKPTTTALAEKKETAAPIGDPVGEEIAPSETTAEPPAAGRAFDQDQASASLSAAAGSAIACRGDAPSGFAKVSVTFAPSGRVTTAVVDGPFAGTLTGGCIAKTFRSARVEPFDGPMVTVRKTVILK